MKYVNCMGVIVRLTDGDFKRYLAHVAATGDSDPSNFGRTLPWGLLDVTDLSKGGAEDMLADIRRKERERVDRARANRRNPKDSVSDRRERT
jgi:hypothetical protein